MQDNIKSFKLNLTLAKLKLNWMKWISGIEEREHFKFQTTAEINQIRKILLQ